MTLKGWALVVLTSLLVAIGIFVLKPDHPKRIRRASWPLSELQPRLIDDTRGVLSQVLFLYTEEDALLVETAFRDLMRQLPEDVRLRVYCSGEDSKEGFYLRFKKVLEQHPREIRVYEIPEILSLWARDRVLARQRGGYLQASNLIPLPVASNREEELNDIDAFRAVMDSSWVGEVTVMPLCIDGGNVVTDNRYAFVGRTVFQDNVDLGLNPVALEKIVESMFGCELVLVGDARDLTPTGHIDMYLTPLGDRRLLLADPDWGTRLLKGKATGTIQIYKEQERLKVAAPYQHSRSRVLQFAQIRKRLINQGFHVDRLPAVIAKHNDWMVTYNNVIMDWRAEGPVVYMPVYELPELDHAARLVYEGLGFEVRPINVAKVMHLNGAVRCLFNVIERRAPELASE